MRYRLVGLVFLLTWLAACGRTPSALPDDAYIWQRQWTPALAASVRQSADLVRVWRVLAAQNDAQGRLQSFPVDRAALVASGRPFVLVVRIDGRLAAWDEDRLLADVLALREHWRGVAVAGFEIDHDCGVASLPAYARFLAGLKRALGADTPLSITALPAWLDAPALDDVLAHVDEAVLQVHAVQSPHAGLFDVALARRWVDLFARRTSVPFRVALPTYGSRVSWDGEGRLLAVESEAPLLADGAQASELAAAPADVARLFADLRTRRPPHLLGVVWFRLPTGEDLRAWSLPTWRAVVRGQPLDARAIAFTRPGDTTGTLDVLLRNDGDVDVALPASLPLPSVCRLADGIAGYALRRDRGDGLSLMRVQQGWLRAHSQRMIGWVRCGTDRVDLHAEA